VLAVRYPCLLSRNLKDPKHFLSLGLALMLLLMTCISH
jgi:hypothetical protein